MIKNILKSVLCCLLCVILFFSMLPVSADAAQAEPAGLPRQQRLPEVVPANARTVGWSGSYYTIENLADLQQLASWDWSSFDSEYVIYYVGDGTLNITENLALQPWMILVAEDIYISRGVTMSILQANLSSTIICNNITVAGTLNVDGSLGVNQSLSITGTLNYGSNGYIELSSDCVMSGQNRINFADEYTSLYRYYEVKSMDAMISALNTAAATTDPRWYFLVDLTYGGGLSTSESITIPANVSLWLEGNLSLFSGSTLTVDGAVYIYAALTIYGNVQNNSWIEVDYNNNGYLNLTNTSTYANGENGVLYAHGMSLRSLSNAISGIDESLFQIIETRENYEYCWYLYHMGGLVKRGTPIAARWGVYFYEVWDSTTGTTQWQEGYRTGSIGWNAPEEAQGDTRIQVYREGDLEPCVIYDGNFVGDDLFYLDDFAWSNPESGTYYFTITVLGDDVTTFNSEPYISDPWVYVKPSAQLGTCTNLYWSWPLSTWNCPENMSEGDSILYEVYYSPTENGDYTLVSREYGGLGESCEVDPEVLNVCGAGYYYFQVRAISEDISLVCSGEWAYSDVFYFSGCEHPNTTLVGRITATCAETGYTGDLVCNDCGAVVELGRAEQKLPHTEEILPAVAPTCTTSGLTVGKRCAFCDETLVAQQTLAPKHTYVDGFCSICGAEEPELELGDANGDGLIDFSDAVLVLEYSAFLIDDTQINLSVSDVNGDGVVDFSDAVLILEYSAFLITQFPAAQN